MNSTIKRQTPGLTAAFFVWGFGALFYLIGFFHRVAPAVITNDLMLDFQISASALGNLSAFYFYSYVAMQIPTGILSDLLGPRRLLTIGALVASLGAVIFGLSSNIAWAFVGRLLIGGSVAVAFVALLKLASNWFAPNRFALVSGLALFCGIIGAVFAGTPLRIFVDQFGWRTVMFFSAGFTVIIALGTWVFVRDYPHEKGYEDHLPPPPAVKRKKNKELVADIFSVLGYRNTILLYIIPGGIVGCVLTFSGLWGVPYLTTLHNISPARAASLTSTVLVAWAFGGPIFGWLSDRVQNRKKLYLAGCITSLLGWMAVILIRDLSLSLLVPILVITGFSSGSMIISFAFAKESVPARLAGTVSGVINMGVMMGPMILQPLVGLVLDRLWDGTMESGVRVYSVEAYRQSFYLMLAWLLLSVFLLFMTKETHCQQMNEDP